MPDPLALVLKKPFAEQVAFFRQKLGNLVPTERWTDLWKAQHDTAFMVAGAMKADLLADLAGAVDRSIAEGKSIVAFRKDFDAIVARHGWAYRGERNWRTRVIYQTNISTSYAAGREAQIAAAGFPYKLYKHSDSVLHPRPLHVSWDGLVLPVNHPFWATHTPPNGWGCKCRVIGIRDEAAARRLGGRWGDAPPAEWQEIDAKTGEPVGVDKGWGYRPGTTVDVKVQQMAAKTQQWEYTLAKAFMQSVPERQRDAMAIAYRNLPSVADDDRRYAARALAGETDDPPYRTLGLLTSEDVTRIKRLSGIDVGLFDYALDRSAITHIGERHGSAAKEAGRGQIAIEAKHFAKLPELLNSPDSVEDAGRSWRGNLPLVRYIKRFDDEEYVVVMEVRGGRKMLVPETYFIRKRRSS